MDSTTLPLKGKRKRSRPPQGSYSGYPNLEISSSEEEEEYLRLAELEDWDDMSDHDFRPIDDEERPRKRQTLSRDQSGFSFVDDIASEVASTGESVLDQENGIDDSDDGLTSQTSRAVSEDTASTSSIYFKLIAQRGAFFGYYDPRGSWIPYAKERTLSEAPSSSRLEANGSTQLHHSRITSTLPEIDWKQMKRKTRLKYERYFEQAVRQVGDPHHDLEQDIHVGSTIWKTKERNALYHSIARRSRLRPDLIAEDIKSKSLFEVIAFIDMMDKEPRHSYRHTYFQHPAANCMSDEWTNFEEAFAEAFINRETSRSQEKVTRGETSYSLLDEKRCLALHEAARHKTSKAKRKPKTTNSRENSGKSADDIEMLNADHDGIVSVTTTNGSSTSLDDSLPNGSHHSPNLPTEAKLFDMKALSHMFHRLYMKDFDSAIQSDVIPKLYRHLKDFLIRAIFAVATVAEVRMDATTRTDIWRDKVNVTMEDVLDTLTNSAVCSLLPPRKLQTRSEFALGLPQRLGRAVTDRNASRHSLSLEAIHEKGKIPLPKRTEYRNFENAPKQNVRSLEEWPLWMTRNYDDSYEEVCESDYFPDDSTESAPMVVSPPLSPTRSEQMINKYDELHDLIEESELSQRFSGIIENEDVKKQWKKGANAIKKKLNYESGHVYNTMAETRRHPGRHFTRHTPSTVVDSDDELRSHSRYWGRHDAYTTDGEEGMSNIDADLAADDEAMSE